MTRIWGFWTRGKLDVLDRYLQAFVTATKNKSRERIYLDLFAGEADNEERLTGNKIKGSAQIALSISDPPFTKVRLFEKETKARKLESALRSNFPHRDLKVYSGDCNEMIHEALDELRDINWAPTFAFIDPNGMEAKWRTLEALSKFRPRSLTKTELFMLFSPPMFTRLLRKDGSAVRSKDTDAITAMFGSDDWQHIYRTRLDNRIKPRQARHEYLNLMRWRLETLLGYSWTHPLKVCNERGNVIYHMIFATDHEAGTRIMSNLYARAAEKFPEMRAKAQHLRRQIENEKLGVMKLDLKEDEQALLAPPKRGERFYEHEPPEKPWFID